MRIGGIGKEDKIRSLTTNTKMGNSHRCSSYGSDEYKYQEVQASQAFNKQQDAPISRKVLTPMIRNARA
jgi:hypothetical protein